MTATTTQPTKTIDRTLVADGMETVNCDLCGRSDFKVLFVARDTNLGFPGKFPIVRCVSCGLVLTNPRPKADRIMSYYPDDASYICFKPTASISPIDSGHPVMKLLQQQGIQEGRLCDIGCGTGSFLQSVQAAGWDVRGVEPSSFARSTANDRIGIGRVVASLDDTTLEPASFDAITLWHVLEHVQSPTNTLMTIKRLLKPGGVLGIAVPNFGSFERYLWRQHWVAIEAPRHFYHFESAVLQTIVTKSGFRVESISQYPGSVSLSANILRTARDVVAVVARSRQRTRPVADSEADSTISMENHQHPIDVRSEQKDRVRNALATVLRPAAWCLAKARFGPELYLLATKATT